MKVGNGMNEKNPPNETLGGFSGFTEARYTANLWWRCMVMMQDYSQARGTGSLSKNTAFAVHRRRE